MRSPANRLPSHEGSGLKYPCYTLLSDGVLSPLARGEWIEITVTGTTLRRTRSPLARGEQTEIGIVIESMRRSTSAACSSSANRRS